MRLTNELIAKQNKKHYKHLSYIKSTYIIYLKRLTNEIWFLVTMKITYTLTKETMKTIHITYMYKDTISMTYGLGNWHTYQAEKNYLLKCTFYIWQQPHIYLLIKSQTHNTTNRGEAKNLN